ncbi:hypothetical protein VOLCADRAFT_120749 [Volvox carteri f. nagariensis]|uniref:Uncharacterized protein n=1 Tax=Volvox carteri f. nagariensis TaxID=3068 RepID=D8TSH8_VOLCA|nr:uncharacterized protein VOLCADRAFT_120749 [Volvox carteri f. nagariensis]EFJ49489.1 hypothetical protein VOLCADRAFT_120749 [Volvox carteri f. nagariensis]|eukprot:XP_002949470.1 hypothetical protein VOLCADRAFT_120749 [Volvox carteri f. nagariensis]
MPVPSGAYKHEISIDGIAGRVRWLPSVPAGPPDLDGRLTNHAMVVWGQQDTGEDNFLVVHDLVVTSRGNSVLRVEEEVVVAFSYTSKMTDLHVCEQGNGQVTVLLGTVDGSLHLLRLMVPRTPGAGPKEVQMLESPPGWPGPGQRGTGGSEELAVWLRPHRGALTAVDMQQDTKNILTAGADGSLFVLDIEQVASASASAGGDPDADADGMAVDMDTGEQRRAGGAGGALPPGILPYKAGSGCLGYTCARWVDRSLFVTSRTVGGLETWDVRCPPAPVSRTPQEWGATGLGPADRGCHRVIHALQVHPSRPDVCATGGSGGSVALWDLRAAARPLALTQPDIAAGPVWEVRFDTREGAQYGAEASGGQQAPLPSVLFCTEDGALCRVSASDAAAAAAATPHFGRMEELTWQGSRRGAPQILTELPAAINSFDLGGPFGTDVVAVTGRQSLLYMQVVLFGPHELELHQEMLGLEQEIQAAIDRILETAVSATGPAVTDKQLQELLQRMRGKIRDMELLSEEQDTDMHADAVDACVELHQAEYQRHVYRVIRETTTGVTGVTGLAGAIAAAKGQARRQQQQAAEQMRRELFAGASLPALQREYKTVAEAVQGTSQVTESLQRTKAMLTQQIEQTAATMAVLDSSNNTLGQAKDEFVGQKKLHKKGAKLLNTIQKQEQNDRRILWLGLLLFLATCTYIGYKRAPGLVKAPVDMALGAAAGAATQLWHQAEPLVRDQLKRILPQSAATDRPAVFPSGAAPTQRPLEPDITRAPEPDLKPGRGQQQQPQQPPQLQQQRPQQPPQQPQQQQQEQRPQPQQQPQPPSPQQPPPQLQQQRPQQGQQQRPQQGQQQELAAEELDVRPAVEPREVQREVEKEPWQRRKHERSRPGQPQRNPPHDPAAGATGAASGGAKGGSRGPGSFKFDRDQRHAQPQQPQRPRTQSPTDGRQRPGAPEPSGETRSRDRRAYGDRMEVARGTELPYTNLDEMYGAGAAAVAAPSAAAPSEADVGSGSPGNVPKEDFPVQLGDDDPESVREGLLPLEPEDARHKEPPFVIDVSDAEDGADADNLLPQVATKSSSLSKALEGAALGPRKQQQQQQEEEEKEDLSLTSSTSQGDANNDGDAQQTADVAVPKPPPSSVPQDVKEEEQQQQQDRPGQKEEEPEEQELPGRKEAQQQQQQRDRPGEKEEEPEEQEPPGRKEAQQQQQQRDRPGQKEEEPEEQEPPGRKEAQQQQQQRDRPGEKEEEPEEQEPPGRKEAQQQQQQRDRPGQKEEEPEEQEPPGRKEAQKQQEEEEGLMLPQEPEEAEMDQQKQQLGRSHDSEEGTDAAKQQKQQPDDQVESSMSEKDDAPLQPADAAATDPNHDGDLAGSGGGGSDADGDGVDDASQHFEKLRRYARKKGVLRLPDWLRYMLLEDPEFSEQVALANEELGDARPSQLGPEEIELIRLWEPDLASYYSEEEESPPQLDGLAGAGAEAGIDPGQEEEQAVQPVPGSTSPALQPAQQPELSLDGDGADGGAVTDDGTADAAAATTKSATNTTDTTNTADTADTTNATDTADTTDTTTDDDGGDDVTTTYAYDVGSEVTDTEEETAFEYGIESPVKTVTVDDIREEARKSGVRGMAPWMRVMLLYDPEFQEEVMRVEMELAAAQSETDQEHEDQQQEDLLDAEADAVEDAGAAAAVESSDEGTSTADAATFHTGDEEKQADKEEDKEEEEGARQQLPAAQDVDQGGRRKQEPAHGAGQVEIPAETEAVTDATDAQVESVQEGVGGPAAVAAVPDVGSEGKEAVSSSSNKDEDVHVEPLIRTSMAISAASAAREEAAAAEQAASKNDEEADTQQEADNKMTLAEGEDSDEPAKRKVAASPAAKEAASSKANDVAEADAEDAATPEAKQAAMAKAESSGKTAEAEKAVTPAAKEAAPPKAEQGPTAGAKETATVTAGDADLAAEAEAEAEAAVAEAKGTEQLEEAKDIEAAAGAGKPVEAGHDLLHTYREYAREHGLYSLPPYARDALADDPEFVEEVQWLAELAQGSGGAMKAGMKQAEHSGAGKATNTSSEDPASPQKTTDQEPQTEAVVQEVQKLGTQLESDQAPSGGGEVLREQGAAGDQDEEEEEEGKKEEVQQPAGKEGNPVELREAEALGVADVHVQAGGEAAAPEEAELAADAEPDVAGTEGEAAPAAGTELRRAFGEQVEVVEAGVAMETAAEAEAVVAMMAGAYFTVYLRAIEYCLLEDPCPTPRSNWQYALAVARDVYLPFESKAVAGRVSGQTESSRGTGQQPGSSQRRPELERQPLAAPDDSYLTAAVRLLIQLVSQYILYDCLLALYVKPLGEASTASAPALLSVISLQVSAAFTVCLYLHFTMMYKAAVLALSLAQPSLLYRCPHLFREPWRGLLSVSELWQRWHQLFRLTFVRLAYRPARTAVRCLFYKNGSNNSSNSNRLKNASDGRGRSGTAVEEGVALLAVFLLSGIIHEYMCWAAFGAARGWQMAFFLAHGIAILLEQAATSVIKRLAVRGNVSPGSAGVSCLWATLRLASMVFCLLSSVIFMRPWIEAGYHRDFWHPVSLVGWALPQLAGSERPAW